MRISFNEKKTIIIALTFMAVFTFAAMFNTQIFDNVRDKRIWQKFRSELVIENTLEVKVDYMLGKKIIILTDEEREYFIYQLQESRFKKSNRIGMKTFLFLFGRILKLLRLRQDI